MGIVLVERSGGGVAGRSRLFCHPLQTSLWSSGFRIRADLRRSACHLKEAWSCCTRCGEEIPPLRLSRN